MLRKPPIPLIDVKLILDNVDERVEAPIFVGYYMLGRDQECQIRPKSSSIADRHCLLEHRSGLLRVFDLESGTGTFVNDERLSPHQWHFLKDTDRLRCGKLEFRVSIAKRKADLVQSNEQSSSQNNTTAPLKTADEELPDKKSIEPKTSLEPKSVEPRSLAQQIDDDDFDIDAFTMFDGDGDGRQIADKPIANTRQLLDMDSDIDESELTPDSAPTTNAEDSEQHPKGKTKKQKSSLHIPKGKSHKTPKTRKPIFSKIDFSDTDSLKAIGSVVFIVVALSALGYQLVQFSSPTTPRIISEEYVAP